MGESEMRERSERVYSETASEGEEEEARERRKERRVGCDSGDSR